MNVDGSNLQKLTNDTLSNSYPRFIPGTTKIGYTSRPNTNYSYAIYVSKTLDLNTSATEIVTNILTFSSCLLFKISTVSGLKSTVHASFNKDGSKVVFASDRNSGSREELQLFVADLDWSGKTRQVFKGKQNVIKPEEGNSC